MIISNLKGVFLKLNKNIIAVVLSLGIFFGILLFSQVFHLFYGIDKDIQRFYYLAKEEFIGLSASKNIIIVEIDEESITALGGFPIDRKNYAPVIDRLKSLGAPVVALDMFFSDKSNETSDQIFASSIKNAGNVIFGLPVMSAGYPQEPLDIFKEGLLSYGYVRPNVEKRTELVYSLTPLNRFVNEKLYEHFSFTILREYYSYIFGKQYKFNYNRDKGGFYEVYDNHLVPYSKYGSKEVLISYINSSKFKSLSFIDLYDDKKFDLIKDEIDFSDKIVLIGATAKGLNDTIRTPYGVIYGVYAHANMINTVLSKNYLIYFDKYIELTLILLLIIVSVYFNIYRSAYSLILSNTLITIIFLIIFPVLVLTLTNLIINFPFELIASLILSLVISNIVKYVIESNKKEKLNRALAEYVSEDIAAKILSGEGLNLEGEEKKITIYFSDIQGFTSISEKMDAGRLLNFLKSYLADMSHIIMDEKGFINKYEGDGIMALWGVFGEYDEEDIVRACKAALLQKNFLANLRKDNKLYGLKDLHVRTGIHFGSAIVGNIGARGRKMEFTALGDNVNIASRLEGVNKVFGTNICVSEDVYVRTKDIFEYRFLGKIIVKGRKGYIGVYELISEKGDLAPRLEKIRQKFQEAEKLYGEKKFAEALIVFEELSAMGDIPSKTYMIDCKKYIKNPPDDKWDNTWELTSK